MAKKIFVFAADVDGWDRRDVVCYAMAEDGTVLGSHVCSNESFAKYDLGVVDGYRKDRHESHYSKHYPDGYEMEFIPHAELKQHAGYLEAYRLNQLQKSANTVVPQGHEAKKYSAEWFRDHARATGAHGLDHHKCSLCNSMVAFFFYPPGSQPEVVFDSACGCAWSPARPSSWAEIADWLAMQSSDEIRDRIVSGFQYPAKKAATTNNMETESP